MDAKLRYVEIKKLFGQYDVEWNIDKDTTVLVGQNGSGKTTILNLLIRTINKKHDEKTISHDFQKLFLQCYVKFSNNSDALMYTGSVPNILIPEPVVGLMKNRLHELEMQKSQTDEYFSLKSLVERISGNNIRDNSIGVSRRDMEDVDVEFISTLNLSANALNNVEIGDGTDLNVLDIQIERAITSFQKLKEQESYFEIKAKVVSVLNDFFSTTQKTIELSDTDFVIKNLKQEPLKLSQLSAGERQIIYIVFKVATAYFNEALILMDEPEISLHLEWQEKLLKNLREINDKSQMIVVTHSPAIIMDGWMDSYVDIQTILKPIKDDE